MKNYIDDVFQMPAIRDWREPTVYDESATIPGQSLLPSELLKRHLAGTLPDIDLSGQYEYHYDEDGNQISEPLPLEMHELHKLAVAIRKREFEEATRQRAEQAKAFRQQIIDEHMAAQQQQAQPNKPVEPDSLG